MGMTLKQAFTLWANAPRNVVLAAKSREAVQRVLMKKWNDIDLEQITPAFAERIFSQSSEPKEMKIKAASILVYLLQWGGDNGHCQRPTFDYTIANADAQPVNHGDCPTDSSEAEIEGTVPCDSHRTDEGETSLTTEQTNDKPQEEKSMEQEKKPRGKQARQICQIDPESLQVIKTYDSCQQGCKAAGVKNIDRAIKKLQRAGGYYWAYHETVDDARQRILAKMNAKNNPEELQPAERKPKPAKPKQEVSPSTGDETRSGQSPCSPSATTHTGDSPRVSHPAAADALAVFSDDELLEELDRRGWEGELSRRQVVTIGAK